MDAATLLDPVALAVVGGGTVVATALRGPLRDTASAFAALLPLVRPAFDAARARAEFARAERVASVKGVLALDAAAVADPDLALAVDAIRSGAGPDAVERLLAEARAARRERHLIVQDWWAAAAETAPAMGMIGTLLGLIAMFRAMDDPATIGQAMAVALLATLYGAIAANLIAAPIAARLQRLSRAEEEGRRGLVPAARAFAAREAPPRAREAA